MQKKYFDWKSVRDGNVFQIWRRTAGGNWQKFIHRDEYEIQKLKQRMGQS